NTWNTFTFSSSYQWDGVSNIVIEFCSQSNAAPTQNRKVKSVATTYKSAIGYINDTLVACGIDIITPENVTIAGQPVTFNRFLKPTIRLRHCDVGYTFTWSHSGTLTDSVAPNLAAGTYTAIVINEDACADTVSATISQPDSTFRYI